MTRIAAHIRQRYPKPDRQEIYADKLAATCQAFVDSGLADPKFTDELVSGSDTKFWSCVSEALLAERLRDKRFPTRTKPGHGPDLLVLSGNRNVWIESICPEPTGVPDAWLTVQPNTVGDFPHQAILLRWTSAIKEKSEKLLGSVDGQTPGYFANGVVASDDAYVIAVNGCRLRHGPFSALLGISQFPFAAEAVFPIGPYQLQINRDTAEVVERGHQIRFHIEKPNKALVPTSMFLDPHFAGVSAIWAVEFDGASAVGNQERSAVIHNPLATNPVPIGFLNADDEFVAVKNEDEYVFSKVGPDFASAG
jgi:type I restriction enzyme S subunit